MMAGQKFSTVMIHEVAICYSEIAIIVPNLNTQDLELGLLPWDDEMNKV